MNNAMQAEMTVDILSWLYKKWSIYTYFIESIGDNVIELIKDNKQITFYIEKNGSVNVIRIWGSSILDEADEPKYDVRTRDSLIDWLKNEETK